MAVEAMVKAPLRSVSRGPSGAVLGEAEGHINGSPLIITLTVSEIHIGWADRNGPAFVIELNPLVKAAVNEIEALLGIQKEVL